MKTLFECLVYDPVQPGFGTSGVRALVTDLTDLEVYCLTVGTLNYFENYGLLTKENKTVENVCIPVACDLRPSSEQIAQATIKAINDCGYQAEFMGTLPSPALACYAFKHGVASFIITGSHIPVDRNGQKANRCDSEVMKTDEAGIIAAVNATRKKVFNIDIEQAIFDNYGMLKSELTPVLTNPSDAARQHYLQRYQSVFPEQALAGLRIVFFEYSAVGRDLLPDILRNAGAEVICCGRSERFIPIDTEAISEQHLNELQDLIVAARAEHGRIDALVSTDGDSDRPLVIAVADIKTEKFRQKPGRIPVNVRFISGDLLGLLVTDYLDADSISIPVSANPAIQEYFSSRNIPVQLTKIGSPYVIEGMKKAQNTGKSKIVAWEANGGYLTGSTLTLNNSLLEALPTRDAILPILCALHAAIGKKQTLYELTNSLPQWYGKAGLLDNVPQQISQAILSRITPQDKKITRVGFNQNLLTLFNLDDDVIAEFTQKNKQAIDLLSAKNFLENIFNKSAGFGNLLQMNFLDGLRCFFDNDEIIHIRPSGNAPQLRIYAYARSQQRADTIILLGIAEPGGLLRQLESQISSA